MIKMISTEPSLSSCNIMSAAAATVSAKNDIVNVNLNLKKAKKKKTKKRVRFGTVSRAVFDWDMTIEERDRCWHRADDLKKRTRQEIQLARRCFKTPHTKFPPNFVFRGLEKRLQSSETQKRKWYSFLHSFLALQHDLRKLEGDVSNLLAVYSSTHSKAHQITALQVARQDEAVAHSIYNHPQVPGIASSSTASTVAVAAVAEDGLQRPCKLKHSNSKTNLRTPQTNLGHARTA